jgi:hypothetical protein
VLGDAAAGGARGAALVFEEGLQVGDDLLDVGAAVADDLSGRPLVRQRVEQVFERHVLVAPLERLRERRVECLFEFLRDHHPLYSSTSRFAVTGRAWRRRPSARTAARATA